MDAQVKNLEELIKYENSNGKITSKLLKYIQKYHYNFTTYSIFNSDAYKNDKEHIKTIIDLVNHQNKEELKKLPILERGSLGSMLGMAIADAMGHRHEFEDVRYNEITLKIWDMDQVVLFLYFLDNGLMILLWDYVWLIH